MDINVLVALLGEDHIHHKRVMKWFDTSGHRDWGVCAFTEAGFLRVMTHPKIGTHSVEEAREVLEGLRNHPGYRYWPVSQDWTTLTEPFRERVFGHQQVTDTFLLGLAVKGDGVLATLDKAMRHLAGSEHGNHVFLIE